MNKIEVAERWETTPLYIIWPDGSDSLCQENGYSLDFILRAMDNGCEVLVDTRK